MEFLVMPQTIHSLVECYSAGGNDGCTHCDYEGDCNCFNGDNITYICTCKGVHVPICIAKLCTIKAEIMNQP